MKDYGQSRCVGCGSCTDVCPSARNGGIVPDKTVEAVNSGAEAEDIWKCLQCHRCNSACPEDIDVAGMICALRNEAASKGDVPERFKRTGQQMAKDLKLYPIIGRTVAQREELGLTTGAIPEKEAETVRSMLKGTGYDA